MANFLLLIVKEGEALEIQRDAQIPRIEHVGGEEDSIQVQLDASTPIMILRMRPVVSVLIIPFQ